MFPYLEQPSLSVGPLTFHAFGVLVASAVVVGYAMVIRHARRKGRDPKVASQLVISMVVCGFLGATLSNTILLDPAALQRDPLSLLRFWEWRGMFSYGGIFAGLLGGLAYARWRGLDSTELLAHLDDVAYAFPFAWVLGRAGCSLAHDHPGRAGQSWLAVRYPDGPRYDLGLLELFYTIAVAALFVILDRRSRRPGFYVALFFLLYAPVRFALDFLRVQDPRHLGWTSGQYASLLAFAVGLAVLIGSRRIPEDTRGRAR